MIHIISTFYVSKYSSSLDNLRSKELEQALLNNIQSPYIEKIHLFVDDNDALLRLNELSQSNKIVVIEVGKKPKYTDFLQYILTSLPNQICMIINSDIFLHEVDMQLINHLHNHKLLYSITRHEYDMSCPLIHDYRGSHDAYLFHSSYLSKNIINKYTDYYQNLPGIETNIIKAFFDEGYKALNPCFQIKIVHLHKSQLRNHGKWIGLHNYGDDIFLKKSCWFVPPITIKTNELF